MTVRTLVVGLDGASWDLLEPMLQRGELPNLQALINSGVRGTLISTTPPMTPPAWTSIATGVNPRQHGIFTFRKQNKTTYQIQPMDYSEVTSPALWNVFDSHDRKIGVVNYPLAYPPAQVDSFFVSGFPATADEQIAYPKDIQKHIDATNYQIQPQRQPYDDPVAYFDEVESIMERQCNLTVELFHRYKPELLWTIFMGTDWIQHYLWDEKINGQNAVDLIYKRADEIIGRLRNEIQNEINEDLNVIVLSDHGFTEISGEIHFNSLLEDMSYLSRSKDNSPFDIVREKVLAAGWRVGQALPFSVRRRLKNHLPESFVKETRAAAGVIGPTNLDEEVDWENTTAFTYGSMGCVYIHDAEQYAKGTVTPAEYERVRNELIDKLESVCHPTTGERLFSEVLTIAECSDESTQSHAPDLIAIPTDWKYMIYGDFGEDWIHPPTSRVADHEPTGILIASGPDFPKEHDVQANVTAITAFLLKTHKLPIVEGMDPTLISELMMEDEEDIETRRVERYSSPTGGDQNNDVSSNDEVMERLEDLGYR